MDLNQGARKYSYYSTFTTEMFLGAKELLKSMPTFYNRVYFSSKYSEALWDGEKEEMFANVTLLTEEENIASLRQIIKNNFLYIGDWDSIKYTNGIDYGFSFIAGNIKYILLPFSEIDGGFMIRSYDVDAGDCYETRIASERQRFISSTMKENGELIRIADFNLEYMTANNTVTQKAEKKAGPQLVTYTKGSGGYALVNLIAIMLLGLVSVATVYASYYIVSSGLPH